MSLSLSRRWCSRVLGILSLCMLFATQSQAASFGLGLEPVIGYEHYERLRPTPSKRNRMIYGARLTLGIPLLSLESEFTRGQDTSTEANGDSVKNVADRLKIGARSTLGMGKLQFTARGGVQGTRATETITSGGVATATTDPLEWKPYAGAGLRFRFNRQISISAEVVAVFRDFPDMAKNEYQTTAGFQVRLP